MNWKRLSAMVFALLVTLSLGTGRVSAQSSLSAGSIQGTVTDAQGAVVPAAKVTITNNGTGLRVTPPVNGAGIFNSGPVEPGSYQIRVEAAGFKTTDVGVVVQVGNIASQSIVLQVGSGSTTVTVEASTEAVNPDQVTIQGVLTPEQIENLPINGRNFLDLAQLEPGVQIQDGGNFDPTKKGFESVSFGGRFGRTARIEVDGLDISDETVGTTTQNISMNSIQEFQVAQSSLDLGTELTSSGTINVTTKSGTNAIHGEGFYGYRDNGTSANIGTAPDESIFTRKQYGVDMGAPIIKDKLFAFGSWERTTQTEQAAVQPVAPFNDLNGTVGSPFNDLEFVGRIDYNISKNIHAFAKFTYEQNKDVASFVPGTYEPFANVDNTPSYAGGVDFTTGSFTHSFRVGYLKFRNGIAAAPVNDPILNPAPLLSLAIGNGGTACTAGGNLYCSGLNILAPQATFQSDKQFKYSGSKVISTHTLVYGVGVNRILGGGFANFFGLGPAVRSAVNGDAALGTGTIGFSNMETFGPGTPGPAGDSNPLNWPVTRIDVGNGEGCFTEVPQFGQPCGGQWDTRFQAYVGDTWKLKPNLTLIYGMRYNRDTGRTDSDLAPIPALNAFQAGLGDRVAQPNHNFGGNLGLAWAPGNSGKTVIRVGIGLNYENGIFNNVLFDRPGRLTTGLFNQVQEVCTQGGVTYPDGSFVSTVDGLDIPTQVCGNAVGNVQQAIADIQSQYQAATVAAGPQANGAYFGASNTTANTGSMFAPNFRSPYAINMNVGFQRELRPGTVLSVDYLRNVSLHTLLGIDDNHQGDARFLDVPTAQTAISQTNASFGCGGGIDAASINCAIAAGATIGSYAQNPVSLAGGLNVTGGFPVGPGAAAFGGVNPNYGSVLLLYPGGRSNYNALQVVLRSDVRSPVRFIHRLNTQVSYSLSRFNAQATDGDFVNSALDYQNPGKYIGPNSLDRTHQLSAGVVMELPKGFQMDFISHWATALPQTLTFNAPGNEEDIFQIDTVGDGQTGVAPIPGTQIGSFGRGIKADDLNNALTKYSNTFGNQLTPAGNALVAAGLFSAAQLQSLCAVTPSLNPSPGCVAAYPNLQIPLAPTGQVGNGALFTFDMTLGYSFHPVHRWESFTIQPQVRFFNLFNHPVYNLPDALLSGILDGSEGSVDGTTKAQRRADSVGLAGLGSGTFAQGAARVIEFGGKISF